MNQSCEFIASDQGLVQPGSTRDAEVGRVAFHGLNQFWRVVAVVKQSECGARMAVLFVVHVGEAFVVQVVEEPGQAPEFFIFTKMARVGSHRRFDRHHMTAQAIRFDPFMKQPVRFVSCGQRHVPSSEEENNETVEEI